MSKAVLGKHCGTCERTMYRCMDADPGHDVIHSEELTFEYYTCAWPECPKYLQRVEKDNVEEG